MNLEGQIPRISIVWLLLAQIAVIVPHIQRLPWWVIVIWLLCALWRLAMFRGEASYPGTFLRSILVIFGAIGLAISFGGLGGLEIAVALLILSFSLKIVEVKTRRDLNLVFYLAFIVIASAFLFSQSIYLAAYQILCILFVVTAMVATQYSTRNHSPMQALRVTSRLVLQAVPIMLVFFLVFPRIPPIWQVPSIRGSASTGMSDTMTPGDIAKLNKSDELAFSVQFEGTPPPREQLYWRGMTLTNFDGRAWTRQKPAFNDLRTAPAYLPGEPYSYVVTMEPTQQHWLYTLPVAAATRPATRDEPPQKRQFIALPDYVLAVTEPLHKRTAMAFQSFIEAPLGLQESSRMLDLAVALPQGYNPRATALALEIAKTAGTAEAFVEALSQRIVSNDYYYTLEPPLLGKHSVDEFLFETRRGFCEHYASAAVVMLRAAGFPARVVVGYQGGEYNALSDTFTIRQFDAHAWTEYWQPGRGWVRYDPTASVAPNRILMGMQDALQNDDSIEASILSSVYYRNLPFIKMVRLRLEAINQNWSHWVINFDNTKQQHLLETLLGDVTPLRTAGLVVSVLLISLVLAFGSARWRQRSEGEALEFQYYQKFLDKLAHLKLVRRPAETPGAFSCRAVHAYPQLDGAVTAITRQFESIVYAQSNSPEELVRLRRLVQQFQPLELLKS